MIERRYPLQIASGLFVLCTGVGLAVGGLLVTLDAAAALYPAFFLGGWIVGVIAIAVTVKSAAARAGKPSSVDIWTALGAFVLQLAVVICVVVFAVRGHWPQRLTPILIFETVALYFLCMRPLFGPWSLWLGVALMTWSALAAIARLPTPLIELNDGVIKTAFGIAMAAPLFRPPPAVLSDNSAPATLKVDPVLALQSFPLNFRSNGRTVGFALLFCVVFVCLGLLEIVSANHTHPCTFRCSRAPVSGWLALVVFGGLTLWGVFQFFWRRLTVDETGLTYRSSFSLVHHPWTDFVAFMETAVEFKSRKGRTRTLKVLGCQYSTSCPQDRSLPTKFGTWNIDTPELAEILNSAIARWGSKQAN